MYLYIPTGHPEETLAPQPMNFGRTYFAANAILSMNVNIYK